MDQGMTMIDPHLGIPVDAAYREETARLLDDLGMSVILWTLRTQAEDDDDYRQLAMWVRQQASHNPDRHRSFLPSLTGWR